MYVTTFYSFKGGVGRTMALVNAAVTLAMGGRRVLVVDFDIEAPGLDTFDILKPSEEVPGIIDFVARYLESGQAPDVSDFIGECPVIGDQGGSLWLMPSGRKETYAENFNQVDWGDLYERQDGFLLFEDLRAQWKQVLKPDYVLIDSRTGYTDTSGICTRQLPDAVVVLFFPNEQNLRGLIDVVRGVRAEAEGVRERNIALHFVMSNVPDLDDEDQILESKINDFQDQLGFSQEPIIVHRYNSLSLLNQVVFTKDRPKSRLAKEYGQIVREISVHNWNDRDGALEYIRRADRPRRWSDDDSILGREEMLDNIEQAHRTDGEVLFRLSELKESHRDLDSALLLVNQAIDAGYDKPEAYLKRSRIGEHNQKLDHVRDDIRRVLKVQKVLPPMVREAISRLVRLGKYDWEELIHSPAILSMDSKNKLWLAKALNRSVADVPVAVFLLEQILDAGEPPERLHDSARRELGMLYMRLGRCSEAARMFRNGEKDITELRMKDAFNLAMALWGADGTIQAEIFKSVIKLHCSESQQDTTPNQFQCMAIAYWAVGDSSAALDCVEQAKRAVISFQVRTEFSCWRYSQVSVKIFMEDLDEIRSLIEGRDSRMPKFMTVATARLS